MALALRNLAQGLQTQIPLLWQRSSLHASAALDKICSGRYRVTLKRTRALTYEMAQKPHEIAHRKSWNAWNTSNIKNGNRPRQTAVEDEFIRRFLYGTWHGLFVSEVVIKRQHNIVRIAGITTRNLLPRKMYFLIGYTQEFLSYWCQCPVKMEIQTVSCKEDVVFKYI